MNAKSIGLFIKKKRKELGLSQKELAEKLFVEPQTISKWERGLGIPDLTNIERMKEIFSCSFEDILEYNEEEEPPAAGEQEEKIEEKMYLPIINSITENNEKKEKLTFFDYLNNNKVDDFIKGNCGEDYESQFTFKSVFKGIFRKRKKKDYEDTLTQGLLKDDPNHNVLGMKSPWLYSRLFLFLLIAFIGTLFISLKNSTPVYAVIFGGLVAAIPLIMFIYEINFSRSLSLFNVLFMFIVGGLASIAITLMTIIPIDNIYVSTIIMAPVFEELAKAVLVIIFVSYFKPKDMLSGLLIGFCVGAGFCVFESYQYAINIYGESCIINGLDEYFSYGDITAEYTLSIATLDSIDNIIMRTLTDFFGSHHYYTGIFGAMFVYLKKNAKFNIHDVFNWKVLVALIYSMGLHAFWNGSACISIRFFSYVFEIIDMALCVTSVCILIKIGINQHRVVESYQIASNE